jgi:hypothetical protein
MVADNEIKTVIKINMPINPAFHIIKKPSDIIPLLNISESCVERLLMRESLAIDMAIEKAYILKRILASSGPDKIHFGEFQIHPLYNDMLLYFYDNL